MKSRLTGRLRRVIAARCNCERAVQRLNPLPLFAPVLVSIAGPPPRAVPHTPSSPLQLPPRGDGAAVAKGERIVPPLLDTLSSRLDCRIEGERKAGAIVSFGHRRQSPPTFLSPVGKKISSFNPGIRVAGVANGGESTWQVSSPDTNRWRKCLEGEDELTSSNEKKKKKYIKLLPFNGERNNRSKVKR